ncbi:MAG: hypothetical protein R3Y27_09445 [Clostridia bacterium]
MKIANFVWFFCYRFYVDVMGGFVAVPREGKPLPYVVCFLVFCLFLDFFAVGFWVFGGVLNFLRRGGVSPPEERRWVFRYRNVKSITKI